MICLSLQVKKDKINIKVFNKNKLEKNDIPILNCFASVTSVRIGQRKARTRMEENSIR